MRQLFGSVGSVESRSERSRTGDRDVSTVNRGQYKAGLALISAGESAIGNVRAESVKRRKEQMKVVVERMTVKSDR